ncbi:rubredoxin-NAD+ reductase, putative [Entamoeba invadens IP1]|uniref:Rubredoxin-NAD+ reductase, putative n=1 Tax=Entamoeba invadens IP1 TaxID=370355 RepID=A0A0A1U621_ENTIV|nr:rubredoxin-NAD+ reductase, putative [Entamoeba invadens IP1]ELP87281.1 rubredoxin-NAD+ reductase, putative [Entamoeba invadens IP1]|eukprot:XP_004254052.1 rubredoxin-NAD+ reductase, putative [Entamoeba invadens IP1]
MSLVQRYYTCEVCNNTQNNCESCHCCGSKALHEVLSKTFTSDPLPQSVCMNTKIVIIGGGIASLATIRQLVLNGMKNITLICKEDTKPYYRTTIPKVLGDPNFVNKEQFILEKDCFYEKNEINTLIGWTVDNIDMKEKKILCNKGEEKKEIPFDTLVFANGGEPNRPPFIKNTTVKDVFPIHTLTNINGMNECFANKTVKNVVIIGGGLCGIEIAVAMKRKHKDVGIVLVEIANRILPKQLSVEASALFEETLKQNNVVLKTSSCVSSIIEKDDRICVELQDKEILMCDMVCYSCGVSPNKTLAEKIGCAVNRGIVVDERMRTSLSDVYACGDCCEYNSCCFGNWTDAMKQGTECADTICGKDSKFVHTPMPYFVFCFTNVFSVGQIVGDAVTKKSGKDFVQIFRQDGVIVGGVLLGKPVIKVQRPLIAAVDKKVGGAEAQALIDEWMNF